jgi:hypothetical protein
MHVLVASPLSNICYRELCETAGENVTVTKHGFESRWGHQPVSGEIVSTDIVGRHFKHPKEGPGFWPTRSL